MSALCYKLLTWKAMDLKLDMIMVCNNATRTRRVFVFRIFNKRKPKQCFKHFYIFFVNWPLNQARRFFFSWSRFINRSGLPHDLSPDQLDELWICEKHRGNMSKNWRPRRTCQYPLHNGWKKQLNTRYALHLDMSREINTIFVELVPTGSLEYDFYVNSSLLTRYCPEMWGRV